MRNFTAWIAILCLLLGVGATPAPDATRRDLAQAYLRLDHALRRNPPQGDAIREVHKTFDYAMVQVFTRNPGGAIQTMDALTRTLDVNAIAALPERWSDERIDSARRNLLDTLNRVQATPDLADARRTCAARINLLTNRDADSDSNVFLNSPDELSKQIDGEIASLGRGEDPYSSLFNLDFWRPIFSKRGIVATRIFAPSPRQNDGPRPLVIALHGAGGDENLFFQGYGAGLIKDLAMKDDFIVIAPNTFAFITVPDAFDAIIDTMSRLYQIDVSRVYVVGHSLGAMTTAGLVSRFPERIRANVQIAGGGMLKGVPKLPPTLVILAELDPIFPLERMKQMILSAKETGLPINLSAAHDIGHAGAVDATLEEAVKFLLSH